MVLVEGLPRNCSREFVSHYWLAVPFPEMSIYLVHVLLR